MDARERNGISSGPTRRLRAFAARYRTPLLIIGIGIAALIVLLTLTKAYLAVRLLIGNDVVLDVNSANATIITTPGAIVALPLTVSVTTNPFCSADCRAVLRDIGANTTVREERFAIRTGDPFDSAASIPIARNAQGQSIYRWEVSCTARPTLLCHTGGLPVTREAISLVEYAPDPATLASREAIRDAFLALDTTVAKERGSIASLDADLRALNATIDVDAVAIAAQEADGAVASAEATLILVEAAWDAQNDGRLASLLDETTAKQTKAVSLLAAARGQADLLLQAQTHEATRLGTARSTLAAIAQEPIANATVIATLNAAIARYDATRTLLGTARTAVGTREAALQLLEDDVAALSALDASDAEAGALWANARSTLVLDALCSRGIACPPHPAIIDLASANDTGERATACARAGAAANATASLVANLTATAGIDALNTTLTQRAGLIADDIIRNMTASALATLAVEGNLTPHGPAIALALSPIPPAGTQPDDPALTTLVGIALIERLPPPCPVRAADAPAPTGVAIVTATATQERNGTLALREPVPRCCALGACAPCCDDDTCRDAIAAPIILVHGHAFNRDTNAAYSLDAFDSLQAALERDGYLSMGTLDLTQPGIPAGSWSRAGVPISVKTSYYYDVYASPDNAALIQTKTENIDTYAIRLKDSIDEVRRRTGQGKVVIIAHSMGGLVARRYLQIFGDADVERVILIGTPNHGITGSIVEYCNLLGEDLECRDMMANSLFQNKLERAGTPSIPLSVIIGSGCDTDGADGDGVVTVESATLPWAHNDVVQGACDGLTTLHVALLDINRYTSVYAFLRDDLKR